MDRLIFMVKNLDNKTWARLGGAAGLVGEGIKVLVVAGDDPSAFGLPVVIINEHF